MSIVDLCLKFMKCAVIAAPPIMLVAFVILPFIDYVRPWDVAEVQLKERYRNYLAVCVGMSSSQARCDNDDFIEKQRIYLLLPRAELASITETIWKAEKTLNADSSRSGFWIVLMLFITFVWLSVRFSLPRIVSILKSAD